MAHKAKTTQHFVLAGLIALPLLAGCGMRGGLARPAPIFKDITPVEIAEPAPAPEAEPARTSVVIRRRVNEFGGEIPDAAPTEPVGSSPLGDPVIPDDE